MFHFNKKKKFFTQRWHKLAAFFPKLQGRNSKVLAHEFSLEHSFNKLETLLSFSPWIFNGAFFQQIWNIVVLQRWDKFATFCQNCIEEKIVAIQRWYKLTAFFLNCSEEIQRCWPMNFHWNILSTNLKHCCLFAH